MGRALIEATFGRPFEGDPVQEPEQFWDRVAEAEFAQEQISIMRANAIARIFGSE